MMIHVRKAWEILREALELPRVTVHLGAAPGGMQMRQEYAAAHPKFPLLGRKQLGACLIDLRHYKDFDAYLSGSRMVCVRRKRRKALRSGYGVRPFRPADRHRELMAINGSTPTRQGKTMARGYLREDFSLPSSQWQTPYGVFSAEGMLVGYVLLLEQGEVATLDVILGHADHLENGIMYLLVTEIVGDLIRKGQARYCFYDMWFGASDGLRTFKRRCGFNPYFVTWQ